MRGVVRKSYIYVHRDDPSIAPHSHSEGRARDGHLASDGDGHKVCEPTAYLGGPMRGIPYFNFPAFDLATEVLRSEGWNVHSPAEKDRKTLDVSKCPNGINEELDAQKFSLAGALAWDFAHIAESDYVIFLPGWERSTGCTWEATVAYALGKPVFQYPDLTPVELPGVVTNPVDVWQSNLDMADPRPSERIPMPTREELDAIWTGPIKVVNVPSGQEIRVTDPVTGASKGSKLARFDLLPWDVIYELAEHYGRGSQKYEDRNWQGGYDWSLSIAALGRHLSAWLGGEDADTETGSSHLIAVAWHAMALRWFQIHGKGADDRYVA